MPRNSAVDTLILRMGSRDSDPLHPAEPTGQTAVVPRVCPVTHQHLVVMA